LHSKDLVNCFWEFFKKPKRGEVYNIGGGRKSNCSVIEALEMLEDISGIEIKKKYIKKNRVGDHIWYVSDLKKFKKHYPNWKQKYDTKKILKELINYSK
jgi:CDP-paratose 2-epimerase